MDVKHDGNMVIVELDAAPAKKLAGAVLEHAEDLSSALLDLANLIRAGQYEAEDQFRQPEHAFDNAPPYAPGVKNGGGK